MSTQFKCDECEGVFDKAWTDDEMLAEADVHGFDPDECVIVCDECFEAIMGANDHAIGAPGLRSETTA